MSIDNATLLWLLGACGTLIVGLISYIFARQGKDIRENKKMLAQLTKDQHQQDMEIQRASEENSLLKQSFKSIKELFKQQYEFNVHAFDQITKTLDDKIELRMTKSKENS